jgi:hypothetical protein
MRIGQCMAPSSTDRPDTFWPFIRSKIARLTAYGFPQRRGVIIAQQANPQARGHDRTPTDKPEAAIGA